MICVTGKMGTGKSTAARLISNLTGFPIVDVDGIGHEVLEIGDVKRKIIEEFGDAVLKDGRIDRKTLGRLVFSDEGRLRKLESIVHPIMVEMVRKKVKDLKDAVVDCALLDRMKLVDICDIVITVVSDLETAALRKGISKEEMEKIWELQRDVKPIGEVVENRGKLNDLERRISEILKDLMEPHGKL